MPDADLGRQRAVVDAFMAAARDGDFDALLAVLDPDIVLRADEGAVAAGGGGPREVRGALAVARRARAFSTRGLLVQPALVNGVVGAVTFSEDGTPLAVGAFTVRGDKIVAFDILADPARLAELDLTVLQP